MFTNSNARHLTNKLGRAPTDGELYIAHFMGANGAARLIGMAEANPGATAAHSFPAAARSNRSIFFDKSGRARNFAEVARNLSGRYDVASARMRGVEGAEAVQGTTFVAETARVARAYQVSDSSSRVPAAKAAAQGEPVFHNPYRTAARRQPVAAVVAELWNAQGRTSQQEAARRAAQELERRVPAPPQPAAAATQSATVEQLGLFQDVKPDVRSLFTAGVRG